MLRYLAIALLCFASSLLGSALTIMTLQDAEQPSGEPAATKTLVAHELLLTDASGAVRLHLQATPRAGDPGQMVFFDENGTPRLAAGIQQNGPAFIELANTPLPNPDHKRVLLTADDTRARIELGHGDLEEIVLQSNQPITAPMNLIRVRGRNGSEAALYTDDYGHATLEVKDATTATLLRVPEWKPLLPN